MSVTATIQGPWNCRWSSPGHRITGLPDAVQPESVWMCARDGERRPVSDDECVQCSRWEAFRTAVAPVAVFRGPHSIFVEAPALVRRTPITIEELAPAALQAVLVVIAILFVALGLAVLTSPMAIPFTIGLWLCAATLLGLAGFGRFSSKP